MNLVQNRFDGIEAGRPPLRPTSVMRDHELQQVAKRAAYYRKLMQNSVPERRRSNEFVLGMYNYQEAANSQQRVHTPVPTGENAESNSVAYFQFHVHGRRSPHEPRTHSCKLKKLTTLPRPQRVKANDSVLRIEAYSTRSNPVPRSRRRERRVYIPQVTPDHSLLSPKFTDNFQSELL